MKKEAILRFVMMWKSLWNADIEVSKLAFTLLWLVGAAMVCGAFVVSEAAPVGAVIMLLLVFLGSFLLALLQMVLFANLPNRILFLVLAGGWLMIAWFFGVDWLMRDPVQLKAWALVCTAMAGIAIAASWRSDLRWRSAGAWMIASIAIWIVPILTEWTEGWFDWRGRTWAVSEGRFGGPFYVPHEDGEHIIATRSEWEKGVWRNYLESHSREGLVARHWQADNRVWHMTVSEQWGERFAVLRVENPVRTLATGPVRSWVDVYDARLRRYPAPEIETMANLIIAAEPYYRFGSEESPWRLVPQRVAEARTGEDTNGLLAWNSETGEEKRFPGIAAGHIGGWLDRDIISFASLEPHKDEHGSWSEVTLVLQTLNLETGEVLRVSELFLKEQLHSPGRLFGDRFSCVVYFHGGVDFFVEGFDMRLAVIDWRSGKARIFRDTITHHAQEFSDGIRVAVAAYDHDREQATIRVVMDDGQEFVLESLPRTIQSLWLAPDGNRVLFSQISSSEWPMEDGIEFVDHRLKVWDPRSDTVRTVYRRGLLDAWGGFAMDTINSPPTQSPWFPDSRRIAIVQPHKPGFPWRVPRTAIRVIDVAE